MKCRIGGGLLLLRRAVGGAAGRSAEEGLRGEPYDSIVTKHGPADRHRSSYVRANLPSHWSWQLRCLRRGSSFEPWMPKLKPLTC
ncbi:hypothetical protein K443DRAFT_685348 [Laccaria amethystina LaAM-08-1]|uniref:Uncharacterized protein n=1 Tax=Laccaria amethystina LaAM-08-1 TaxID=1095629 RepID=A0A0C9WUP5_9AGAR|nr:hypothetical protein K443DRAFT_685348 [Laccaria amethystina LaAM-08-1]